MCQAKKVIYTLTRSMKHNSTKQKRPFPSNSRKAVYSSIMSRVPATTHTCPVCGHTGPCTQSAGETGQFRYHNCHVCGSTWKEVKVQDPADKDSKPLQTA